MSPKIFVALPIYQGLQPRAFRSLLDFFSVVPCELNIIDGCPELAKARSELVGAFLHTSCTHLLFLDSDVGFGPQTLRDLLTCDVDIVLAAYQEKREPHHWTCAPAAGSLESLLITHRGLQGEVRTLRVERAGLGSTLIRREVFEKIQRFNRELMYRSEATQKLVCHMFASMIEEDLDGIPRLLSEDSSFYRRAATMGFEVNVLLDATVDHAGVVGNLGKTLDAGRKRINQ